MSKQFFQALRYKQNEQEYLSIILPLGVINSVSKVLIYDVDPDGYQRQPNDEHLSKIKNYALNNSNFTLPTSIILGIDKNILDSMVTQDTNGITQIEIDTSKKNFRIVDGQHRILGLSKAANQKPEILEFPFNVIVLVISEEKRSIELEVFTDINSKNKRINTDLAELAKHDYQIKEQAIKDRDINRHIAIKTAYYLKEKREKNIWQNAIKFDIHSEVTIGIIGVVIFSQSIKVIIDKYIHTVPPLDSNGKELKGSELIEYCKKASDEIGEFILRVWNEIVYLKWGKAFKENFVKNDEGDLVKIFYNKDYYIQKGLGIKSINPIIGEIVSELGMNKSFERIKEIINNSNVTVDDWKNGATFAGYNSESGFNKIKKMIQNLEPVPKK